MPVEDGDDRMALETYLTECLKIRSSSLAALGVDRVRTEKVPFGPKSKFQKEIIVYFPTTEARDVVKGSARNLATLGQNYGVRLELPNHLKSTMQAIQSVSYDIKQRHPQARRTFCLTTDPRTWCLISPSLTDNPCLLYTSPSPRDRQKSRMPSSA